MEGSKRKKSVRLIIKIIKKEKRKTCENRKRFDADN